MTQGEIARRAKVSVSFLSMIERGERSASLETLSQISEALGCNLEELFAAEDGVVTSSPAFEALSEYLRKKRINKKRMDLLLAVAKAVFAD